MHHFVSPNKTNLPQVTQRPVVTDTVTIGRQIRAEG
jgi:hypothetical protein